jgi:hypothetical protein
LSSLANSRIPADNLHCRQRDSQECVLTGNAVYDVAHIFPYSMLNQSSAKDSDFDFWEILKTFWSDNRIREWQNAIFTDQNHPDKGVEACYNLICLSHDAHHYWTKAYFALKPIQLSDDKKTLDVEFHWLPQYNYSSAVDLLHLPAPSEGSPGQPKVKLYQFSTNRKIYSGQKISLTTADPEKWPLPHPALLEMQWILHRLVAMSGAAEIYDDDDAMALRGEWDPYKEEEWDSSIEDDNWNTYEEESPPMMVGQSSPPPSPLRQPSLPSLSKSNIRSDYIPLRPAENPDIKIIGSSQGQ